MICFILLCLISYFYPYKISSILFKCYIQLKKIYNYIWIDNNIMTKIKSIKVIDKYITEYCCKYNDKYYNIVLLEDDKDTLTNYIIFLRELNKYMSKKNLILNCCLSYNDDIIDVTNTLLRFVYYFETNKISIEYVIKYICIIHNIKITDQDELVILLCKNDIYMSEVEYIYKQILNKNLNGII